MTPTWILTRGNIITFDRAQPRAEAVAIAGRRIVAVGSAENVEALAGSNTRVTDLSGATLMPSFCDTHMHLQKISRDISMLQAAGSKSISDVLAALRTVASETPPGEWIRTFADTEQWHEQLLTEGRLPTQAELDVAAPEHPVFLYRRNDAAVLNSLAAAHVESWLADQPAANWDATSGRLGGGSVRALNDRLYHLDTPTRERALNLLGSISQRLLRMGITSVVDPGLAGGFAESWELYGQARRAGLLIQRVHLMNRLDYRLPFDDEIARVCDSPAMPLEGDNYLRAWAVKLLLDGEFSNAWLSGDQGGDGEAAIRYSAAELAELMTLCAERRWPLCVHVMGGGAIEAVLNAVREAVDRSLPIFPGQVSLAHAFLPEGRNLSDCANYGVAISVQPLLAHVFAREMRGAWGALADGAIPIASMLHAGIVVAGGSDTLPCEPFRGAHLAASRQLWDGTALSGGEAVEPHEALALFTRGAGEYVGWRHLGVVRAGCIADLAIWPGDPLAVPSARWAEFEPLAVTIDGELKWPPGSLSIPDL